VRRAAPVGPRVDGRRRRFEVLPYLLIAPVAIFIILLAFVPAIFTIIQSFFKVNPLNPPTRFVGVQNFIDLWRDSAVTGAAVNTGLYVVIGVAASTAIGIGMAVLLQQPFRGRGAIIAILILPWALPGVVEGLLWLGIFDPNAGLINGIVSLFHPSAGGTILLGTHRLTTVFLIELVQVWQITPLSTLLIFASLQLIPNELYEAAEIDGANQWRSFLRITLPLARPGIAVAMVESLVATLNVFDQPYVLNGSARTGASLTMQTYFISFQNLDFGKGYALSLVVAIVTVVCSLFIVRFIYRKVEL
jgi:multiple sugar transport system permease protein